MEVASKANYSHQMLVQKKTTSFGVFHQWEQASGHTSLESFSSTRFAGLQWLFSKDFSWELSNLLQSTSSRRKFPLNRWSFKVLHIHILYTHHITYIIIHMMHMYHIYIHILHRYKKNHTSSIKLKVFQWYLTEMSSKHIRRLISCLVTWQSQRQLQSINTTAWGDCQGASCCYWQIFPALASGSCYCCPKKPTPINKQKYNKNFIFVMKNSLHII